MRPGRGRREVRRSSRPFTGTSRRSGVAGAVAASSEIAFRSVRIAYRIASRQPHRAVRLDPADGRAHRPARAAAAFSDRTARTDSTETASVDSRQQS